MWKHYIWSCKSINLLSNLILLCWTNSCTNIYIYIYIFCRTSDTISKNRFLWTCVIRVSSWPRNKIDTPISTTAHVSKKSAIFYYREKLEFLFCMPTPEIYEKKWPSKSSFLTISLHECPVLTSPIDPAWSIDPPMLILTCFWFVKSRF